jgi:hypothetical protein
LGAFALIGPTPLSAAGTLAGTGPDSRAGCDQRSLGKVAGVVLAIKSLQSASVTGYRCAVATKSAVHLGNPR